MTVRYQPLPDRFRTVLNDNLEACLIDGINEINRIKKLEKIQPVKSANQD